MGKKFFGNTVGITNNINGIIGVKKLERKSYKCIKSNFEEKAYCKRNE